MIPSRSTGSTVEMLERRLQLCVVPLADFTSSVASLATVSAQVVAPGTTFGVVPGTIQAEDFDTGDPGTAYYDKDAVNHGGLYRQTQVDIKGTADSGGGYAVGWTAAGEWLRYTLDVAKAGTYRLDVRVASAVAGGQFKLYVDGADKSGTLVVPNTGGWETYATIGTEVNLAAGSHAFELRMTANNPLGAVGNFNWFKLTSIDSPGTPTPPSPSTIRINVGGAAYTDSSGNVFAADDGYATGGITRDNTYPVGGTTNDTLYANRRYGQFSYHVPIANGTYTLSLYFADSVFDKAGQRLFDLYAEGKQLLNDYDIVAEAGGQYAVVKTFTVNVTDGAFDLNTVNVRDNAILSAIALVPTTSSPVDPVVPPTIFKWTDAATNPVARYESQGTAAGGKLYVFGGFYTIDDAGISRATLESDVYDPATNKWTRIADVPEPITHAGVVVDGDTIWLAGGLVGDNPGPSTNHVWKYSISQNKWTAGPSLPADRAGGAFVKLGRELHFAGGGIRHGTQYISYDAPDHWVWNLDTNDGWKSAPPIPNPRNHLAATELNGKMYTMGGQHLQDEISGNQREVDIYDPVTKKWSRGRDIPIPLGHVHSSITVHNGKIIVTGGLTNGKQFVSNVFQYDPADDSWTALVSLPAGRQSPISAFINGQLIVTTGLGDGFDTSADTWVGTIHNTWEQATPAPVALGEVTVANIANRIIVIGSGNSGTFGFDPELGKWSTLARPVRPYVGDHHASEVIGTRMYLIGGLGGGSEGKVQYYDLTTNKWGVGASMPFAAGAVSTALIGGKIYAAGGIIGSATTNRAAVYDPAANIWTELPPMPVGVNHAASNTDGNKFYIFGGRDGANVPSNGFDYVQIYDPATNKWTSSSQAGSTIAPLPQARGGMGKAVYYEGEFYILGGETVTGAGATANHVYARVDVYNPVTNTWRRAPDMPTARHGIFPVLRSGRLYVIDGGIQSSTSKSAIVEILNLD